MSFKSNIRSGCRMLALIVLLSSLSACAVWSRVDNKALDGPGGTYHVQAPAGWVRFNLAQNSILITRDGVPIQHISIVQSKDVEFFKQTKVKLAADTLPSDLAQMVLAEMRSDKSLADLIVKKSEPFTVAGRPGFRVHFQYRDERGALFDRIVLGTSKGQDVIIMTYHGLNKYYFERDLDTFYKVAKSFSS